jgi:hypothetical protein
MAYYTRVLSKLEEIPALDELQDLLDAQHPHCQLSVEEGDEQEWETLLLSGEDGLEIALIERLPVFDGSAGQDVIADFIEDTEDCLPVSGVNWLHDYFNEVKVVYAFQHLQGADFDEGSAACMVCARPCGSGAAPSFKPTTKASPTRKAFILSGSFPTPFQVRGTWRSCRMKPGLTS